MTSSMATGLARWRLFFLVAAVYDIVLGIAFFFFATRIFEWLGMAAPPHISYFQLPAVFVFVQGVSYLFVWADPLRNLGLVKVGVLYKAGYAGLAAYYLVTDQIPAVFFAWFGLFDLLFLIGFVWFLRRAGREAALA
ncbi:MAG: hypothetical protein MUQ32_15855 [Chloroflexi bacterium]|nr:hypothetical protein [Chloroflexota bacterium]